MALIREEFEWDGRTLVKHYSDKGMLIHKIGTDEYYGEAADPIEYEAERVYEETDIPIDGDDEEPAEE